jgi:hypothetical protein
LRAQWRLQAGERLERLGPHRATMDGVSLP